MIEYKLKVETLSIINTKLQIKGRNVYWRKPIHFLKRSAVIKRVSNVAKLIHDYAG